MAQNQSQNSGKSKRGFAGMSESKQREIASQGGKASHKNDSNQTTSDSSDSE